MGKIREFPLMLEKVDAQSSYDADGSKDWVDGQKR